jgi:serine/threonine protein kinase
MGYPAFTSYLNTQQQTPTDRHSLFKAIMHSRAQTRDEQQMIEETGWGDFSEAEVQSLADLLSHMLERNVEDRWTAAQALKHELLFGTV